MKRLAAVIYFALFLAALLSAPVPAHAACFKPPGNAGDLNYNGGYRTIEYCDGGSWVKTSVAGDTARGLAAWWKFDDGSGTTAADSSGNSNTGALQNSPTWTTGMNGGALTFNGTSQYVSVANASSLNITGDVTISAWCNPSSLPNTSSSTLVTLGDDTSGGWSAKILAGNDVDGNPTQFSIVVGGTEYDANAPAGAMTNTGTWYHLVGVRSGATIYLYINGALVATRTAVTGTMRNSNPVINIGEEGLGQYFPGSIDDVRVYNRALSAADAMTLYTSTGGASGDINTGLIHYWKFDESSGTTASDAVGGATATFGGTAGFTTSGLINNALNIPDDGSQGSVTTPANMLGISALTESVWIKFDAAGSYLYAYQQSSGGADSLGIEAFGPSDSNQIAFEVSTSAPDKYGAAMVSLDTNWHMLTLVFDGTQTGNANRIKGYIDGVVQTLTFSGGTVPATTTTNALPFTIGSYTGAQGGAMDELRIYNRALSASDVLTLYNTTATSCTGPTGYTGDMRYNAGSYRVMQFCNGTNWIPMGKVPGTGGGGCSSPTGGQGDVVYNNTSRAMQYCDGSVWRSLGWITPISGLVGWWNLDEASGTSAADSTGNGHTGTLNGNAAFAPAAGKFGGAVHFTDGTTNTTISVPDSGSTLDAQTNFSVSAWVYFENLTRDGGAGVIPVVWKLHSASPFESWDIEVQSTGSGDPGELDFDVFNTTGASWTAYTQSPALIAAGGWHHIVGVKQGANLYVYLDGADKTSGVVGGSFTGTPLDGDGNLLMGGYGSGSPTELHGYVDDVRFYNKALSASEVWRLYNGAP